RQDLSATAAKSHTETRTAGGAASTREVVMARPSRARKGGAKAVQTQLPLTIVSKGRFDKSEPTKHNGEDLDVPTFLRRGVSLN
ncbi:MAG TPA: hypothetical protein VH251_02500, partial [Verrucomicrobiae bacterium]|nr:hypothetical protein [Verrucomicrobiae bacterium]